MKQNNFNTTLIGMYEKKSGNFMSLTIDARAYDNIKKAFESLEIGGKLIIKRISEESKQKFQNPDTAPDAFLEYISKKDVQAFENKKFEKQDVI